MLDKILAVKRQEMATAAAIKPLATIRAEAQAQPAPRDFVGAIRNKIAAGQAAVIAEIKKASPSKGVLREDLRPVSYTHLDVYKRQVAGRDCTQCD